ncbi:MAG: LysR substrate-binding domain-containing protein [Pseudomonadota bacterium]
MILDSDQLRTFVAVAETKSFTRAAQEVHRTQAAVSMQIKKLEERIGRALFDRSAKETKLTTHGQTLLSYARKIIALNEQAVGAFQQEGFAGEIKFGLPDDYAERLLPMVLAAFHRSHPGVEMTVECKSSNQVGQMVREGTLDMGLVTHADMSLSNDDRAVGTIVRREHLVWIGSDALAAQDPDPVPLALSPAPCAWRIMAIQGLQSQGRQAHITYCSHSAAALNSAVAAGLAFSVLPESAIRPDVRVMTAADGFPPLPMCDIAIVRAKHATLPVHDAMADHIMRRLSNFSGTAMAVA